MIDKTRIIGFAFFLTCLVSIAPIFASESSDTDWGLAVNGVRLRARFEHPVVRLQEPVTLLLDLQNIGTMTMYYVDSIFWEDYRLTVIDAHGSPLKPLRSTYVGSRGVASLKPGETVTTKYNLTTVYVLGEIWPPQLEPYQITARRWILSSPPFEVISNTTTLRVSYDKDAWVYPGWKIKVQVDPEKPIPHEPVLVNCTLRYDGTKPFLGYVNFGRGSLIYTAPSGERRGDKLESDALYYFGFAGLGDMVPPAQGETYQPGFSRTIHILALYAPDDRGSYGYFTDSGTGYITASTQSFEGPDVAHYQVAQVTSVPLPIITQPLPKEEEAAYALWSGPKQAEMFSTGMPNATAEAKLRELIDNYPQSVYAKYALWTLARSAYEQRERLGLNTPDQQARWEQLLRDEIAYLKQLQDTPGEFAHWYLVEEELVTAIDSLPKAERLREAMDLPLQSIARWHDKVYASNQIGVFRASLQRQQWQELGELSPGGVFATVPAKSSGLWYAAPRNPDAATQDDGPTLYYTINGIDWVSVNNEYTFIDLFSPPEGTLYGIARIRTPNEGRTRILRSHDQGSTWEDITGDIGPGVNMLRIRQDPDHAELIIMEVNTLRTEVLQAADTRYHWQMIHGSQWLRQHPGTEEEFFRPELATTWRTFTLLPTMRNYFHYDFGAHISLPGYDVIPEKNAYTFTKNAPKIIEVKLEFRTPRSSVTVVDQQKGEDLWGVKVIAPNGKREWVQSAATKAWLADKERKPRQQQHGFLKRITLKTGESYTRTLNLGTLYPFIKPGTYKVQVVYDSMQVADREKNTWPGYVSGRVFRVVVK